MTKDEAIKVLGMVEALICNWRREQDQYHED